PHWVRHRMSLEWVKRRVLSVGVSFFYSTLPRRIQSLQAPQGTAQGSRYKVQGKNNKRRLILSLCLAPYALRLTPLQPVKLFNSDLARTTRFSWLNKLSLKNSVEK
ncbi:MAG: hypothetical protein PVF10_09850, partial [Syntrophobacterales bacterium]